MNDDDHTTVRTWVPRRSQGVRAIQWVRGVNDDAVLAFLRGNGLHVADHREAPTPQIGVGIGLQDRTDWRTLYPRWFVTSEGEMGNEASWLDAWSADEPRPIDLVRELDEALHGVSVARPTSPLVTWTSLLDEVRARVGVNHDRMIEVVKENLDQWHLSRHANATRIVDALVAAGCVPSDELTQAAREVDLCWYAEPPLPTTWDMPTNERRWQAIAALHDALRAAVTPDERNPE